MADVLTATTAIVAAVAALVAAVVAAAMGGSATIGSPFSRAVATLAASIAVSFGVIYFLVQFEIGPFERRSITIASGAGDVACRTELAGSVDVPKNEAAWVLLVNESGDFYPQGPSGHGAPVAVGGESKAWKLPGVVVTDTYYANATYQVVGVIIPLADSLRLQQLLANTDHLPADQIPSRLLSTAVEQAKLVSSDGCTS